MPENQNPIRIEDISNLNKRYQTEYDQNIEDTNEAPYDFRSRSGIGVGNFYQRDKDYDQGITLSDLSYLNSIRAYRQSGGDALLTGLKNMLPNVGIGIAQQIRAGAMGLNTILPDFLKDDYNEDRIQAINNLEEAKNPFGTIYRRDPDNNWDISDSAWWAQNGTQLLGSIIEFGITGLGAGSAIKLGTKGLTKGIINGAIKTLGRGSISQGITKGLTSKIIQQGLPQLLTSGVMAYTEGALTGAQVYKQIYDELYASTGNEELAREEASKGASKTVAINTAINTALNIYGLGPIFKNIDNVKFGFKNLKRLANETQKDYLARLSKLGTEYTGSLPRTLKHLLPEAGFEALEEGVNVFAEKVGLGEIDNNIDGFIKAISSEEGTLAMVLGAIGGVGTMSFLDNVPKFTSNPNKNITKFDSNRTTELKEKKTQYAGIIKNLKDDLKEVITLNEELDQAINNNDNKKINQVRESLFNLSSSRYIVNGNSDVLIESLNQLKDSDQQTVDQSGKTLAEAQGLDTNYKQKVDEKIAKIKKYEQIYNQLKDQYTSIDEEAPGYIKNLLDLSISRDQLIDNINVSKKELLISQVGLNDVMGIFNMNDPTYATEYTQALPEYKKYDEINKEVNRLTSELNNINKKYIDLITNPEGFKNSLKPEEKKLEKILDNSSKKSVEEIQKENNKKNISKTTQDKVSNNKTNKNTNTSNKTNKDIELSKGEGNVNATSQEDLFEQLGITKDKVTRLDILNDEEIGQQEKDITISEENTNIKEDYENEPITENEIIDVIEEYYEEEIRITDKLINPSFSIAYGTTRTYDEDNKGYVVSTNTTEYNQEVNPIVLDSNFNIGSKIFFKIAEDFKPFITKRDIVFVDENGNNVIVAQEGFEVTYSLLESFGNSMIPISILNENNDIIGYVHDLSYIRNNRVVNNQERSLTDLRNELIDLRNRIINGFVTNGNVSNKSTGKLAINEDNEFKLTSEAILGEVEFVLANSEYDIINNNGDRINILSELSEDSTFKLTKGGTYAILPTPNGSKFYLPLKQLKLENKPEYIEEILEALQNYYNQEISYFNLQETFSKYLYSYPSSKLIENDNFIVTESDKYYIDYNTNQGITFGVSGGIASFINQNTPQNKLQELIDKLEDILKNSYINISQESLKNPEFIKANTTSNITSIELPNGDYTYFDNPVIEFNTSQIIEPSINRNEETITQQEIKQDSIINYIDPNYGTSLEISEDNPEILYNPEFNLLIDNEIDSVKQIETINFFTGYVLGNFKLGIDRDQSYNQLKKLFQDYSTNNNPKISSKAGLVYRNIEEFINKTNDKLRQLNLSEEDFQGETVEENNNFDDGRSLKENPNEKATANVKKLFSSIVDIISNENGEIRPKKNWLGLPYYLGIDEVMNTLAGHLVDIEPEYGSYLNKLKDLTSTIPFINSVIELLNKADDQTKIQFTIWATKHTVNKELVQWNTNEQNNNFETVARIINSNGNSVVNNIINTWYNNFLTSEIVVRNNEGDLLINKDKQTELLNQYKDIYQLAIKNDLEAITRLNSYLNTLGIESTEDALNAFKIATNNGTFKGANKAISKLNFIQHFTSESGIFNLINKRLFGEFGKDIESEIDKYNPTLENSALKSFANFLSRFIPTAFSNSFRDLQNNVIYSYSVNKYAFTQFNRIFDTKYINSLLQLPFQSRSSYLNKLATDEKFRDTFNLYYIDGIKKNKSKKGKAIDDMSPNEQEKFRFMLFQNKGDYNKKTKTRNIKSTFLTTSDKSTLLGIETSGVITKFDFKENTISKDSLKPIFDLVLSEWDRIDFSNRYKENNKFYNNDYDNGSKYFYLFPELNYGYNGELGNLYEQLYDSNGNLKSYNTDLENIIYNYLNTFVLDLAQSKLETWRDSGLLRFKNNQIDQLRFFDKTYLSFVKDQVLNNNDKNQLAKYAAIDYVLNTQIVNGNLYQMFAGDPANYYKKGQTINNIIKETYINIGKRLAGLIAPGISLANTKVKDIAGIEGFNYTQLFLQDLSIDSDNIEYLKQVLSEDEYKAYTKGELKLTDAQEYTTLKEHLYIMYHSGKLTNEQYISLLNKYKQGEDYSKSEIDVLLQPIKPVFFDTIVNDNEKVLEPVYIKTSSFPLIPQLTKGLEIDKLRINLEEYEKDNNTLVRAVYKSGAKIGGPKEYKQIFNKQGQIEISDNNWDNSKRILNREGFRIQQEVPFKEKELINTGSQETKLLWTNLLDIEGFEYNNKKYNGAELKTIYNNKYRELYQIRNKRFRETFVNSDGTLNLVKLKDELIKEGISRNWNPNDLMALNTIEVNDQLQFSIPLYFNNSSDRIESLLISIVDNKIRKNKSRGYSGPLGSPAGFKTINDIDNTNIVTVSDWDGKTLKGQRIENGIVRGAQVLLPFKFKDNYGNILNLKDFINENNQLDLNKIDKGLLESFGFRIPTQLHSSMSYMEIVGFLPQEMGDLIIAPADFIAQMGSDFDIDKLYGYLKYSYLNPDTNKLEVYTNDISEDSKDIINDLKELYNQFKEEIDNLDEQLENAEKIFIDNTQFELEIKNEKYKIINKYSPTKIKELLLVYKDAEQKVIENDILDIHFSIMKNNNSFVQKQVILALGMGSLPDWKKRFQQLEKSNKYNLLSDEYQKVKYQNARGSKALVGVFSVSNTFNTVLQSAKELIYGSYTKVDDESIFQETIFKIDGKNSNRLYEPKTITGKYKSEVHAAFQSAAVDNEKESILEYLNINPDTSNTIIGMIQSGFDEDYIIPLINQPIILELIKRVQNSKDSTSDTRRENYNSIYISLFNDLIGKVKLTNNIKYIYNDLSNVGVSLKDLNSNLESPINEVQLKALITFDEFNRLGKNIQQLASTLNTDSSGLDKNFIATNLKEDKVINLTESPNFIGLDGLYDSINYIATEYSLFTLNDTFGQLYSPFKSKVFRSVVETIKFLSAKEEQLESLSQQTDYEKGIWNDFKSFIYSGAISKMFNEDVDSMRDRLLTGDNSLAKRVLELKKNINNNSFLNRLDIVIAKKQDRSIDKIEFKAAIGNNLDELDLYTNFEGLIRNEDTKQIGEDLVKYFYITGGIQEARQFGKYISNGYLSESGFGNILNDINLNSDNPIVIDTIVRNYFQNNPVNALRLNQDDIQVISKDKSTITEFRIKPESLTKYVIGSTFIQYLSESNFIKENEGQQYNLYEVSDEASGTYRIINTKGGSLFSEYGLDKFSVIPSNNKGLLIENEINKEEKSAVFDRETIELTETKPVLNTYKSNLLEQYSLKENITNNKEDIINTLNIIIDISNDKGNQVLAGVLKSAIKYSDVKLILSDKNGFDVNTNTILINKKQSDPYKFEQNILHEIIHVPTASLIKSYFGENKIELSSNQKRAIKGLENLVTLFRNKIAKGEIEGYNINELLEYEQLYVQYRIDRNLISNPERFVQLKDKYYGLIESDNSGKGKRLLLEEAITMALTSYEFQQALNNTKYDSERSIFDRLIDLVKQLYLDFINNFRLKDNTQINKESYLSEALRDIFVLTFDKQEFDIENKYENKLEKSLSLAKEKSIKNFIKDENITYLDIPKNLSEEEIENIFYKVFDVENGLNSKKEKPFTKKYLKSIKNYEEFIKVKNRIVSGEDLGLGNDSGDISINSIEKNIFSKATQLVSDNTLLEGLGFEKLLNDYNKDNIPLEYIEEAKRILIEYNLFQYINYNPNQLRLFPLDNPEFVLDNTVANILKSLPKEERDNLRELMNNGTIKFKCD